MIQIAIAVTAKENHHTATVDLNFHMLQQTARGTVQNRDEISLDHCRLQLYCVLDLVLWFLSFSVYPILRVVVMA